MFDFSNETCLKNELKNGNSEVLNHLMSTYHHPLCLYAFSLSKDKEDAKDIVQNVFIKLWENREKADTIVSIKRFLYKAVYNRFIDLWRKKLNLLPMEVEYEKCLEQIVEEDQTEKFLKQLEWIKKVIEQLPPKCKETLLLSKKEGLTNIEIAEYLDVSIRTVEGQISKAFKILREKLNEDYSSIFFMMFRKPLLK